MPIEILMSVYNFPLTPAQAGVGMTSVSDNPNCPYPCLRRDERI